MMISASGRIVAVLLSLCLGACAFDMGGDSGSGATDQQLKTPGGIPYSRTCARTQCEADCEAATAEDCSECNAACWSVMTGTGSTSCIDTCASVCQPSCGCSDDSPCVRVGYEFDYGFVPDENVTAACLSAAECFFSPSCYQDAIILDPEKATHYYACEQVQCDGEDNPSCWPSGGNFGQLYFATGCYPFPGAVAGLNGMVQAVKKEARETLEWCLSLGDCAEVEGCVEGALRSY